MTTIGYTIPPKDRSEWLDLVTGKIEYKFQNYVLQMKTAEYSRKINSGDMTPKEAIDDMYALCEKYALAVKFDFQNIFKEW